MHTCPMVAKKKKQSQQERLADRKAQIKQVLVGGPLLGSRQRTSLSDFAPWDRFEPIITPEIQSNEKGDQSQRFILLPHSNHINVLAYQTGTIIASLVPYIDDNEAKDTSNQVIIESVCLAKFSRKLKDKTVQDVLNMNDDSEDEVDETTLQHIVDDVVVLAGCQDGTLREFSLKSLKDSPSNRSIRCRSYHIPGACHRPRRVMQVSNKEPIMLLTAPPIKSQTLEQGTLVYMAVRTKDVETSGNSKNEKSDNMNITIAKVLLPPFDGTVQLSLVRKDKDDIQRKWHLDKFRCRVGKDSTGSVLNTSPFRLESVVKPLANDYSIFIVLARANSVQVYYDLLLSTYQSPPMIFPVSPDNPLTAIQISTNNDDIACGHYSGSITIMNKALSEIEQYHQAILKHSDGKPMGSKPEDPRKKIIKTKSHWHSQAVGCLFYDTMSSPLDPILYSGGTESVLVTWQMGQGRSKPLHFLPRVSLGAIVHIACPHRLDDRPSNGVLVYSEDNTLQLFESYSKGSLWKIQGLAYHKISLDNGRVANPIIQIDPLSKGAGTAQLVISGLPQAPGFIQWYDTTKRRLTASLEVAPFNRISKAEREDSPMPVPSLINHTFCNDGKELITVDETPSENLFVGAYVNEGPKGAYGVVTTMKFWTWNPTPSSRSVALSHAPYTLVAAMSFPHGPKNRVSALAGSASGSMVCTVSNDEKAFRLWTKLIPEEGNETKRMPAWTCMCKVTIPAGFSNFTTERHGVAFSDDGSTLALSFGNMVTLWDSAEARFLTCLRHLEGATGVIDKIQFVSAGRLQDVLLIKSDLGVSLQSPFGTRGGFKGWNWGIPTATKDMVVASAEYLRHHGCVAITVYNSTTGNSHLTLIDAITGKPGIGEGPEYLHGLVDDFEGRIVSMSASSTSSRESAWAEVSNDEETIVRLFSLSSNGILTLSTKVDDETPLAELMPPVPPSRPSLSIIDEQPRKRKRNDEVSGTTTREPISKKSALELFGLVANSDGKGASPSTADLPSLSKIFVRAFVGRQLLREHKQSVND